MNAQNEYRIIKRRKFLELSALAGTGAFLMGSCVNLGSSKTPAYLKDHQEEFEKDARKAAINWFENARYGMFIHYGPYSILGRHEWVQYREKIPVAEYAKLKDRFTAEKFDADFYHRSRPGGRYEIHQPDHPSP